MNPVNLAMQGLKIFPCVSNGKEPLIRDWESRATDSLEQIREWSAQYPGCNWAVATGPSDLVVVDVDTKGNGNQTLIELDLEHPLPESQRRVKTPSGGLHLYFRGQTRSRVRMLPGIDIRSSGGYVLALGEVNGAAYSTEVGPIPPTPEWLANLAGAPRKPKHDESAMTEPDRQCDLDRAEEYLRHVEPAIEGNGGDAHTYRVALQVRDLGLSEETAVQYMLRYFDERCEPPWGEDGIRKKVENAFRYGENAHGSKSLEARIKEAQEIFGSDPLKSSMAWRSISEVGNTSPAREWVATGWIPFEIGRPTLIVGEGGTGKSLAVLQLAWAVANGEPWFGVPTEQMPAYYVSCEDTEDELDRRTHAIKRSAFGDATDIRPAWVVSRVGLDNVIGQEVDNKVVRGPLWGQLDTSLAEMDPRRRRKLVILDTVADVFAGNENCRHSVNAFIKTLIGSLAQRHNAAIILVGHPSKGGASYSGSTAWNGAVSQRLFMSWLNPKNPGGTRSLKSEKANYAQVGSELFLDWKQGILVSADYSAAEKAIDDALLERIAVAAEAKQPYGVNRSQRPLSRIDICGPDGRRLTGEQIQRSVDRLVEAGSVKLVAGKKHFNGYHPTDSGYTDAAMNLVTE